MFALNPKLVHVVNIVITLLPLCSCAFNYGKFSHLLLYNLTESKTALCMRDGKVNNLFLNIIGSYAIVCPVL